MTRKETPDILSALMGESRKQENPQEIEESSNKAINAPYFDPKSDKNAPIFNKEKATFNLSKSVLNDLEDCWIEIRKLRKDKKISKTDIVEGSIQEFIREFRDKKQASKLYRNLEKSKGIKQ